MAGSKKFVEFLKYYIFNLGYYKDKILWTDNY